MNIKPLRPDLEEYLLKHNMRKKFDKASRLFEIDPFYPSLRTELLEPRHRLIYSFRIDNKYRALFINIDGETVEIIAITNHYK